MPRFESFDGLSLHYTQEGQGVPLLCLPGLTRNGNDFQHLVPHLKGHRIITLDCRGRGRSDWDAQPMNYQLHVEIKDILSLLDHLNVERAAMIGTSRGGLQAMMLARQAPERMIGAALNDIGPDISQAGLDVIIDYVGRPPVAKTHHQAAELYAQYLYGFSDVPMERWLQEARAHYVQTPQGLELRYDPALREALIHGDPLPDFWECFEAMSDMPLCVIRGANSMIFERSTADKMKAVQPHMIYADIPNRGHVPFLDEPQALEALHLWLQQIQEKADS